VPILDLEDVAHQTITGQAVHEVNAGSVLVVTEDLLINLLKWSIAVFLQRTNGHCVGKELDETFTTVEHHDFVRMQPQRKVLLDEYIPYCFD
jgi:hypothetical protein